MNRDAIRAFLADPAAFAKEPAAIDAKRWRGARTDVAEPAAQAGGVAALRPAQQAAWTGFELSRLGLVLGPPGTGKTFVLALMVASNLVIARRADLRCRVLVSAFTKTAISNVLEKVVEILTALGEDIPVVLLGPYDAEQERVPVRARKELGEVLEGVQCVIGATTWQCFGALERGDHGGSPGFTGDLFDLVCIDEASQLPVSQGLMAVAVADAHSRILVAGDNRQLPPIAPAADWEADERGLCGSLYDFLRDAEVPEFALTETFRLNAPLAAFPKEQFYEEYGPAPGVADRRLALREGWEVGLEPWLRAALHPDHPVTVLLYDGAGSWATRNPQEVEILVRCVAGLRERLPGPPVSDEKFWNEHAAVVTPHRAQNAMLRARLTKAGTENACVVETVERIQGRERDALIVGYCVSDPEFALVEASFLYRPERFNVTITRARSKLILVLSRRLLEVVPTDQNVFDAAQVLREFVFRSDHAGDSEVVLDSGKRLAISVFTRRFGDVDPIKDLEFPEAEVVEKPLPELTARQESLLAAIQVEDAATPKYDWIFETKVAGRASLSTNTPPLEDLHLLLRHGYIELQWWQGRYPCWKIRLLKEPRRPYPVDPVTVRARVRQAIDERRSAGGKCWYPQLQSAFVWLDVDGQDLLRPILDGLSAEGWIKFIETPNSLAVDYPDEEAEKEPASPPSSELDDEDFGVLNALEDLEVARLNFGVYEAWTSPAELASAVSLPVVRVDAALRRLEEHGHLLYDETLQSEELPQTRSRMAELAREIRYVRQRWRYNDRDEQPFLVRSMKVVAMGRGKPERSEPLSRLVGELRTDLADVHYAEPVLDALEAVLTERWGTAPRIAGFQYRAIGTLLRAWCGLGRQRSAVVTAATGAGKTEAACLPLLAGAAIDHLQGTRGTRAVLVYPRIRLAWNQAQRLVGYASALSAQPGMPLITIGAQNKDVPSSWEWVGGFTEKTEFRRRADGSWVFPFFRCPGGNCDRELLIRPGEEGVDTLECTACDWSYAGWIGTKQGLRSRPPHLFLPVTESLHQWMQDDRAYGLWGDRADLGDRETRPPRALLADEVHLYSLVSGAQVGYTLRRLLGRIVANSPVVEPAPLAIGMSATLGDPVRAWSTLVGRERSDVCRFGATEAERQPNPRAREYYYFVQPEVESRGKSIKATSTTIQTLMCLAHGMRRRSGTHGGFRGLVFLDSIDKLKRLHFQYGDAERRRLPGLRTTKYPDDAQGRKRAECCGKPATCDVFHAGECWFFAAKDARQWTAAGRYSRTRPLAVSRKPIWSATKGADEVIRKSDVVFATSSLEVGYDDPEMTLVYQQFAPQNLASFIQRKGRGGRGADDRPVTGVTLSLYSPRDSYYFRRPERMLRADDFEVPLNVDNFFVRRGQALSLLLDCAARHQARTGWRPDPMLPPSVFSMAAEAAHRALGPDLLRSLDVDSLEELWTNAVELARAARNPLTRVDRPLRWLKQLEQAPNLLFKTVNLPQATVLYPEQDRLSETKRIEREWTGDILLAVAHLCPGNMTRRWGTKTVHWTPWLGPEALMCAKTEGERSGSLQTLHDLKTPESLLAALPQEARDAIGAGRLHERIARVEKTRVEEAGYYHYGQWKALWVFDEKTGRIDRAMGKDDPRGLLDSDCVGRLSGCALISANTALADRMPSGVLGRGFPAVVDVFRGRRGGPATGLQVAQVYWGADIRLHYRVLNGSRRERGRAYVRQLFVEDGRVRLYGFRAETEGLQVHIDSGLLDRFIGEELIFQSGSPAEARWLRGQFLRYLVSAGAIRLGINSFQVAYLSRLLVAAAAVEEWRKKLKRLVRLWDPDAFFAILQGAWARFLTWDPEMTETRVEELEEVVRRAGFREMYSDTMRWVGSDERFEGFLRSITLHGLAIRLKQAFVLHGRGDDRRILFHAQLPIQFAGSAHDVLTLCERGAHGDGTTRTFVSRAHEAAREWDRDGIVVCPNAEADEALRLLLAARDRHTTWLAWDPRSPKSIQDVGNELGIHEADVLQSVGRALFGEEEVTGEVFRLFDLHLELQAVASQLEAGMRREPSTWELVGAVVTAATTGAARRWSALLSAYGRIPEAVDEGTLSPASRLAEQAYRLSGRLCRDGCLACLHSGSDLFDREQAQATVSRRVLERFWAFAAAEAAHEAAEGFDEELIGARWAPLLLRLQMVAPKVCVEPGRDIPGADGRVAGSTFAILRSGERVVELIDDLDRHAEETLEALRASGGAGLRVRPSEDESTLQLALEGTS